MVKRDGILPALPKISESSCCCCPMESTFRFRAAPREFLTEVVVKQRPFVLSCIFSTFDRQPEIERYVEPMVGIPSAALRSGSGRACPACASVLGSRILEFMDGSLGCDKRYFLRRSDRSCTTISRVPVYSTCNMKYFVMREIMYRGYLSTVIIV